MSQNLARIPLLLLFALMLPLASCGGGGDDGPEIPADFEAQAADFECLLNWPQVRNMRITNRVGLLEEAISVAEGLGDGREFPVGTIIQLVPFEAMVKRGPDFDPANNNWEYFELGVDADGTQINVRGRDEAVNQFGANCFNCHMDARDRDFICENGNGCIDLPFSSETFLGIQNGDPRCG